MLNQSDHLSHACQRGQQNFIAGGFSLLLLGWRTLPCLVLSLVFYQPYVQASESTTEQDQERFIEILVLGDSLSSAYGLAEKKSWVNLIKTDLTELGYHVKITNASVSGQTSKGGLERLRVLLEKHRPDLVIVALGANDALRGLPLKQLRENLTEIMQLNQGVQADVILAAIPVPRNYGTYVLEKLQSIYQNVAEKFSSPLVNFFGREFLNKPESFQEDGLHPTAQTQSIIADAFLETIQQTLQTRLAKSVP